MKETKKVFEKLYITIGEAGFEKIAELLLRLLCITPLITGIINYVMLLDIPSYDPYLYNYRCIIVSSIGFVLMTLFWLIYCLSVTAYEHKNLRQMTRDVKKNEPWLFWWLALLIWGIVTCLTSVYPKAAFLGGTILYSGYITHVYMLCVMGCAYLLSEEGRRRVLRTYVIVSDILVIIMLSFNYDIPFLNSFSGYAGVATFTNSNHYGYYLAMAIPCLAGLFLKSYEQAENDDPAEKKVCIAYLISYIVHMQGMVINDCMGAFLGVFFALVILTGVWIIRKRRIALAYFIPVIMLLVMVYLSYIGVITSILGKTTGTSLRVMFNDIFKLVNKSEGYEKAGTNRIKLWKETIEAIKKSPILGYGPDIITDRNEVLCVSMTPHNEFLECALYMGIPGVILYIGGLLFFFADRIKRIKKLSEHIIIALSSVVGYLISSFFGVRKFHIVPYMFMFLGMTITKKNIKEKEVLYEGEPEKNN